MEKIECGMYVRTKYNTIRKIIKDLGKDEVYKNMRHFEVDKFVADYKLTYLLYEEDILKARNKVGELLQVGDFLDNHCIVKIEDTTIILNDGWFIDFDDVEDLVETIVTKEQFKSMQYRIGD